MSRPFILVFSICVVMPFISTVAQTSAHQVAFYPLNNNAYDIISGHNGTIFNGSPAIDRFNNPNAAMHFNGNGYISIPPLAGLDSLLTGNFTISFWGKTSIQTRMYLFSIDQDTLGADDNINLELNDISGVWMYWNSAGNININSGVLGRYADGNWNQYLIKRDTSTKELSLYINGELVGTKSINTDTLDANESPVAFGQNINSPNAAYFSSLGWKGDIDDIAFFNTALTNKEILDNYSLSLPFTYLSLSRAGWFAGENLLTDASSPNEFIANYLGQQDGAVKFDSVNQQINFDILKLYPYIFNNNFTLSFWFKGNKQERMYALSFIDSTMSDNNLDIQFNNLNGLYAYWNGAGGNQIRCGEIGQYTDSAWHHFVMRRNAGDQSMEIIIDGSIKARNTIPEILVPGGKMYLSLGGRPSNPDYDYSSLKWNGGISDIYLYPYVLNDEGINLMLSSSPLIAKYPLDNHGEDIISRHNGELVNGSPATDRFGVENGATKLSGNGYLKITPFDLEPYYFSKEFTISLWARSEKKGRKYLFSVDSSTMNGDNNNLNIELDDLFGYWSYWNSNGINRLVSDTIGTYTDSMWHHYVLRNDRKNNKIAIFIDGQLKGEKVDTALTIGSNNTSIVIGANLNPHMQSYFQNLKWNGEIDDLYFYTKSLSNENILQLFQRESSHIQIRSPKVNVRWSAGSKHYIEWTTTGQQGPYDVLISFNNSSKWDTIVSNCFDRRYLYQVADSITDSARIIVRNSLNNNISDTTKGTFAITPSTALSPNFQWERVTLTAGFAPRDGAGAITANDTMYLLGGWNPYQPDSFPKQTANDVWASQDGQNWNKIVVNAPWEERHTAGYLNFKNKLWVLGGDPIQGHYQNDVWNSTNGINWELVNTEVPWKNRVLHHTIAFKDSIWVMGGQTLPQFAPETDTTYNDVWNSADGVQWQKVVNKAPWAPRGIIGGHVVLNNKMWVLGGGLYETPMVNHRTYFNDVWSTEDGRNWEMVEKTAPWDPRQYHDVAAYENRMWVLEGFYEGNSVECDGNVLWGNRKDVWYSIDGSNWYELPCTPWAARHASSIFVYRNALWVVTGNNLQSDVWRLRDTSLPFITPIDSVTNQVLNTRRMAQVNEESRNNHNRSARDIEFYPNPVVSNANLFLKGDLANCKASIIDNNGRTVAQYNIDRTPYNMNLLSLSSGAYTILVYRNGILVDYIKFIKLNP